MSKRNRREHGRILSVETKNRGDSLADDFAAGVTSITVNDAGDFDEPDGNAPTPTASDPLGWLLIGSQTVAYIDCDDDTGVITLADPLAAAAEQGDPVHVWSDLYGEVVDYQLALVELDGEYDNPDPVAAEVAEGVGELPEGDRGKAGESCTLHRVADDEWEVVGVGGRPRQSQGIRFEDGDGRAITQAEIDAAEVVLSLSKRPIDEALTCVLAGVPQRPTNWTINYNAQTLTMPLSGWERAGDVLWVHYAYTQGITTAAVPDEPPYDPTACSYVSPTTCTASIYVFNTSNWKSRITINGTWKGGGPLTTLAARIVYRDAADPAGTIKFSAELQLDGSTINTMMEGGYYGGDRTGAHIYGVHLGPSATWSALTPQNGGTLGTTDPTQCRFWWGEQIAVTADRSDEPMGDINGNLADWWSLL